MIISNQKLKNIKNQKIKKTQIKKSNIKYLTRVTSLLFLNQTMATNIYDIKQDFKFAGLQTLSAYLNDTVLYNSVLEHGCWCTKIDTFSDHELHGGPLAIDDLDKICKKWFHVRSCNDRHKQGSCHNDELIDAVNKDKFFYRLTIDSVPATDYSICQDGMATTNNKCEVDSCVIDTYFSEQILQHFMFNPNQVIQTVNHENSVCDLAGVQPFVEKSCQGIAPFLEIVDDDSADKSVMIVQNAATAGNNDENNDDDEEQRNEDEEEDVGYDSGILLENFESYSLDEDLDSQLDVDTESLLPDDNGEEEDTNDSERSTDVIISTTAKILTDWSDDDKTKLYESNFSFEDILNAVVQAGGDPSLLPAFTTTEMSTGDVLPTSSEELPLTTTLPTTSGEFEEDLTTTVLPSPTSTTTSTTTTSTTTTTTTTPTTTTTTTTTPPPTTQPRTTPEGHVIGLSEEDQELQKQCIDAAFDLTILIDGSGSVHKRDFDTSVDFVQRLVDPMNLNELNARITVAQFSYFTRFYTSHDPDRQSVNSAIQKLRGSQYRSMTYTNYALDNMLKTILQYGRSNVQQILLLVTDGKSTKGLKVKDPITKQRVNTAQALHDNGIITYAIGVGESTDKKELKQIATDPDESFQYDLENFDALESIRSQITEFACSSRYQQATGRSGGAKRVNYKMLDPELGQVVGRVKEIEPWEDRLYGFRKRFPQRDE